MSDSGLPDPPQGRPLEIELEPTVVGRLARWTQRARLLRTRVESARVRHASVDLGFDVVERDSAIGGGLLAGAPSPASSVRTRASKYTYAVVRATNGIVTA